MANERKDQGGLGQGQQGGQQAPGRNPQEGGKQGQGGQGGEDRQGQGGQGDQQGGGGQGQPTRE